MNITTRKQAAEYSEKCLREYHANVANEPGEIRLKRNPITIFAVIIITAATAIIFISNL